MKRVLAVTAAFAAFAVPGAGLAVAGPSKPPCQPGQQGNSQPGFKPGSCDNDKKFARSSWSRPT